MDVEIYLGPVANLPLTIRTIECWVSAYAPHTCRVNRIKLFFNIGTFTRCRVQLTERLSALENGAADSALRICGRRSSVIEHALSKGIQELRDYPRNGWSTICASDYAFG